MIPECLSAPRTTEVMTSWAMICVGSPIVTRGRAANRAHRFIKSSQTILSGRFLGDRMLRFAQWDRWLSLRGPPCSQAGADMLCAALFAP